MTPAGPGDRNVQLSRLGRAMLALLALALARHSRDFRSLVRLGTPYAIVALQAAIVRQLSGAYCGLGLTAGLTAPLSGV